MGAFWAQIWLPVGFKVVFLAPLNKPWVTKFWPRKPHKHPLNPVCRVLYDALEAHGLLQVFVEDVVVRASVGPAGIAQARGAIDLLKPTGSQNTPKPPNPSKTPPKPTRNTPNPPRKGFGWVWGGLGGLWGGFGWALVGFWWFWDLWVSVN